MGRAFGRLLTRQEGSQPPYLPTLRRIAWTKGTVWPPKALLRALKILV